MAFNPETTLTPESIGRIEVFLSDDVEQKAEFDIAILMSDGTTQKHRRGDLVPHITPTQRQGLLDFMAALRVQAGDEILP
jgi:hypothetical protein